MKRTVRLRTICGEIIPCDIFADVGCDHGYCAEYVLKNNLCRKCYISDISAPSLHKAELLLSEYIQNGTVNTYCCPGLELIPHDVTQVLIAGMGGEEIIGILKDGFFPKKLVLQPMKNSPKVRSFLLEHGYDIVKDYTFFDGKYYDVICAEQAGIAREYHEREILFGYDNLHSPTDDFIRFVQTEAEKCKKRGNVESMREKLRMLTEVLNEITGNIQ